MSDWEIRIADGSDLDTSISIDGQLTSLSKEASAEGVAVLLTALAVTFNSLYWALADHQCWDESMVATTAAVLEALKSRPHDEHSPIPRPSNRAFEQAESLLADLDRLQQNQRETEVSPVGLTIRIRFRES